MYDLRSIFRSFIALGLSFASLQAQTADDDIRGSKPLVEIPEAEKFPVVVWATIAGIVALLAVALLLWRRHARKQRLKSPREIALAFLADLESSRETMTAESFAYQAAIAVRQYVFDRFGIAAPRRTTEEFLRNLTTDSTSPLNDQSDQLRAFLTSCDLAKFAGREMDLTHRAELVQAARAFIEATAADTQPGKAKP